jgi:DNA invertase Pin-like site-specific DNA recombinase
MARCSRKHKSEDLSITTYKTAIYARLSRESQAKEVIETQIQICREWLGTRPFFTLVDIYSDSGYTGTNFNRPDFERLMEDVRNGKINCIIVKDLSRFGRNHIAAGDYIENIFPFLDVRFIAITDAFDNINLQPDDLFITNFKNFAHAHFARETSYKVANAKRNLQEKGLFIGSKPPFGYLRDPADKHKLVINEETKPIVIEIFTRYVFGETYTQICEKLNARGVKTPSGSDKWKYHTVSVIIESERYIGTLVQHKTSCWFYKNETTHKVPKDEQIRCENVIPPIISQDLWDKTRQRYIEDRTPKNNKIGYDDLPENIFKGIAFCETCGGSLSRSIEQKDGMYRNNYSLVCRKCGKRLITFNELVNVIDGTDLQKIEKITIDTKRNPNIFFRTAQ